MENTCNIDQILGVFPSIQGVDCNSMALLLGFSAILGSYIFWSNVTK